MLLSTWLIAVVEVAVQPKLVLQLLGSSLITFLAIAPILYSLHQRIPPRLVIASVDLQALITEEEERFVATTKTESLDVAKAAAADRVAKFTKAISSAVDATAAECGCVLINRAAIVSRESGIVEDLTPRIRQRIAESIK